MQGGRTTPLHAWLPPLSLYTSELAETAEHGGRGWACAQGQLRPPSHTATGQKDQVLTGPDHSSRTKGPDLRLCLSIAMHLGPISGSGSA